MAARNRWNDPPLDGSGSDGEEPQKPQRLGLPPELQPVIPDRSARLWIRLDSFLDGSRSEGGMVEFTALQRALDTFREEVDEWIADLEVPITDDAELMEVALDLLGTIAEGRFEGREESKKRKQPKDGRGGDDPLRAEPRRQHRRG